MTCLFVIGITVASCFQDAPPPESAVCHPVGGNTIYCTIGLEDMPAYLSWYDGLLGGINCVEPCDQLGDGTPTAESYGWAMACPKGLYGRYITFEGVGTWQCRDHGNAITVRYGERYTSRWGFWTGWHVVFDLSMQHDDFVGAYDVVDIVEVR